VATTYVLLKFSRSEGRSWSTGVAGLGDHLVSEARDMAKGLMKSCDYIEVVIEERDGANTLSSTTHLWTKARGWT
jgi:hypothetical protein